MRSEELDTLKDVISINIEHQKRGRDFVLSSDMSNDEILKIIGNLELIWLDKKQNAQKTYEILTGMRQGLYEKFAIGDTNEKDR